MANYHVLNSSKDSAVVAFHVPTPSGTNFASKTWADAYKEYKEAEVGGAIQSEVPWLETGNPTEFAQVQAGTMVEKVESVALDGNATDGQKATTIDARWTALSVTIPNKIQEQLNFWGLDRNV
jgi:hypothetical protein